jgi:hypothetical protein
VIVGVTSCVPPVISRPPSHVVSSALLAEQDVAFPLPQVSVLDPVSAMVVKSADSVGPGGGPTTTVVD